MKQERCGTIFRGAFEEMSKAITSKKQQPLKIMIPSDYREECSFA
jgi:hypothetical protein